MYVFSVSTGRRVNGRTGQKQSASKVVDILCLRKCIHNRPVYALLNGTTISQQGHNNCQNGLLKQSVYINVD